MDTHAMVATSIQSLLESGGKRFFFRTLDAAAGRALEADATARQVMTPSVVQWP
jgi:branched-chain amino acid transport system substrate-binding protein